VFEHAAVRGALVTMPETVRAVLACHPYPPPLQRVLAELVAATALLASTLKFTGSLIMQLQGDGPVRLLVVECTAALELRAMAQWDAERIAAIVADATLADLAGGPEHGRLVLTLDPKGAGTIYQGIVALEAGSVAGLIEHYLATSEQLASRMLLATDAGSARMQASSRGSSSAAGPPQGGGPLGGRTPQASSGGSFSAAGLFVLRLPGATEEDDLTWNRARDALEALDPSRRLRQRRGREVGFLPRTVLERHDDQRLRVDDTRDRPIQHPVRQRVDARGCPDPDRQRQRREQREARPPAQ